MNHIYNTIRNATIGFIVASLAYILGLVLYWQFNTYEIADVQQPIEVQNHDDIIEVGGIIQLLIVIDKPSDIVAQRIETTIVCDNSEIYGATNTQGARNVPTGSFIRERYFKISDDIRPNLVCVFQFDNQYKPNPIRTINLTWQSEPFETVERSQ